MTSEGACLFGLLIETILFHFYSICEIPHIWETKQTCSTFFTFHLVTKILPVCLDPFPVETVEAKGSLKMWVRLTWKQTLCPLEEWRGVKNLDYYWCQMQQSLKYVVFREVLDIKIQENIKQNILALIVKQVGQNTDNHLTGWQSFFTFLRHFLHYVLCVTSLRLFADIQKSDSGRLFWSALPRQSLHEAAGYCWDDDDAHEQGRGDADNQRDEEEVSSWGKKKEDGVM